jgi:hypothetical protein
LAAKIAHDTLTAVRQIFITVKIISMVFIVIPHIFLLDYRITGSEKQQRWFLNLKILKGEKKDGY